MQEPGGPVKNNERVRVFRAMAVAFADRGVGAVALAEIAALAGVAPRKLRTQFADVEECFLAAFEWCAEQAGAAISQTYIDGLPWADGVRVALGAILKLIEQEPDLARLSIVYSLGAGPRVLRRRAEAITVLCEHIDRGRLESAVRPEPPAITAEGVLGALLAVLQARLLAPDPEPPRELLGELMSLVLLPYLGSAAAKRELARAPLRRSRSLRSGRSAVKGAGLRLTYRTARVLRAIAERPGANNREVANRAEVVDQGQISKLLGRLESEGLIANAGGGPVRGTPNAWQLTLRGEQVEDTIASMAEEAEGSLPR